ncbi:MAG: GntR family transcriptional regulator [Bacillota bacterium]|nr:GntR family transcriptional regulator [Bacillota bacterium]
MFRIDLKSRKSIYEQVVDNVKELIITGVLQTEARLPSVRELASSLTINPNTVQKAYRELERQGYIYTAAGLGSFVAAPAFRKPDEEKIRETLEGLKAGVRELRYLGVPEQRVRDTVEEALKGGEDR